MTDRHRSRTRAIVLLASLLAAFAAIGVARLATPAIAAPIELFISEYVEGSSNNKAIELANGTGAPVTLTGAYDVQIFANGSPTATATIPLTGTVADGDVFVLARSSAVAAILAEADQTSTNFLWNGNDAVALRHDGATVDVIGQIGVDPGTEWGATDASTADNTIRRKAPVESGDPNGDDAFDPALEWDGFALDTFSGLGSHTIAGGGGGGGNRAPVALADTALLEEDDGEVAIDVLANDSDPDGDPFVIATATDPVNGTVSIAPGGAGLAYTPEVDFAGNDAFTYSISDGNGGVATASVTVVVEAANDDPDVEDDAASTSEDTSVTIDVLANDDDQEGDPLSVIAVGGALNGAVLVAGSGTAVAYEPDEDFNGTDTFEYVVGDGNGGEEAGEVTVTVTPVDDPPVARPDAATVPVGGSVVLDVLANDAAGPADESGQTLSVTSVTQPEHGGTAIVTEGPETGRVRYTPAPGYVGADAFSYVVSDGMETAVGNVGMTVRQPVSRPICSLTPTILGTLGDDVLTGTPGDDVIRARRGNDVIDGNGGRDVICGGPGADRITTGAGPDRIAAGSGPDVVVSGAGNDRVRGGFGADDLSTGDGGDSVAAGGGADVVAAGDGANAVAGGPGDDSLTAGGGNDRLDGGAGTDTCDADGGRNTLLRCE